MDQKALFLKFWEKEAPARRKVISRIPKEILDAYDRWHDDLTKRLHRLDHAAWEKQIPFLFQGQEVARDSGYEYGWGFLFDQIHHRGQLTTYLRPMGSTVPQIYGPSADEPM